MKKILCVFCGQWFDWHYPGDDDPANPYLGAGCCGEAPCGIEASVESVKLEKFMIAMEALGREVVL